ncbi:MAG: 1,4-dihydroxy-6-naphthoate synthase [Niabella sp.]|nr:MAG: 1,4-dihydroxy-6-naphthoate synthase [Niabella sp.]
MKLSIGISPCPNDTYIFDAIYNKKIDCTPFEFQFYFEDVETLNKMSFEEKFDCVKLSYAQYFNILSKYVMLKSGSALGSGVGPLLISNKHLNLDKITTCKIAIPGIHTTANFLFDYAFPNTDNKIEIRFDKIENAILNNEVDAGVIIHENRFTYQSKGFKKLIDLGDYWEEKTSLPIPLGGIAVRRNLPQELKHKLANLIKQSIMYANTHNKSISNFVQNHAQEMDKDVMQQHINLYVNNDSLYIGAKGIQAVHKMKEICGVLDSDNLFA